MICVFEKGYTMPLCAKVDDVYCDLFNGLVYEQPKNDFINRELKNKKFILKELNVKVYIIYKYIIPTFDREYLFYNLQINGASNFLSLNRNLLDKEKRSYIIDKLINKEFVQEDVWGDDN